MLSYHKIQTVFDRDPDNRYKTLLVGQWARPEFAWLADNEWVFTEKIDGTNIRVDWDSERAAVQFGGRTERAQIPTFLFNELGQLFPISAFGAAYPDASMTLYGEGYGAKIQKGGGNYIPDGVSFILFDVRINDVWLERHNVEDIAGKLGIDAVPILGKGTLMDAVEMVADGFPSELSNNIMYMAEGLVMRPAVELLDRLGHRIITKVKYKDFAR